jgi:hypothetical protein
MVRCFPRQHNASEQSATVGAGSAPGNHPAVRRITLVTLVVVFALPSVTACAADLIRHSAGGLDIALDPTTATPEFLSFAGESVDLTPDDISFERDAPGWSRLGDLTLRWRCGRENWRMARTADRKQAAAILPRGDAIATVDATPLCIDPGPLRITRSWQEDRGALVLVIEVANGGAEPVELGGVGLAMVFNTIFNVPVHPPDGDHVTIHEARFYVHPALARDSGYVQVVRVNGCGPVLVIVPEQHTPLEAWRPISEHPARRWVEFEGFHDWCVHSLAWAETEWQRAHGRQWNEPTSRTLGPGETARFGFRFVVAPGLDRVEDTLIEQALPVAIGIPGYVVSVDESAELFVRGPAIESVSCTPPGTIAVERLGTAEDPAWTKLRVRGSAEGTARLTLDHAGGRRHEIHYRVIAPSREVVRRLARFHVERQWRQAADDPFGRHAAFMPFDRETDRMLVEHQKDFIVGLSDEPGAGATLLMAMKNLMQPDAAEVNLLERYAEETLWKNLQNEDYSVRAALHWGGDWNEARSRTTWRAYNYPHQAAIYWALHRLARDHEGLVRRHSAKWYLQQACRTGLAMKTFCGPGTGDGHVHQLDQWGLMVGSVFREILLDLRRAGLATEADEFEAYMRSRADVWSTRRYPFGSEMPWGPTGQEEIYTWCDHFGMREKAEATIDTILAGVPLAPSWGYNGSMHFYFAALTYGKWSRVERELHWYLSSLSAIPTLQEWRQHPQRLGLLRRGHAGSVGVLTNIDARGHGSMSFHASPDLLEWDPYTGDYGVHFYGYCQTAAAYVAHDPRFGWLCFGGRVEHRDDMLTVHPTDAFRRRVYLGPAGMAVTVDAGVIDRVVFDLRQRRGEVWLAPASAHSPRAFVTLVGGTITMEPGFATGAGRCSVPTGPEPVKVAFQADDRL